MRAHTIGEVLNELKDEFDDVTISKIRFLEAEGLISPDRTESGYRKFSPADVERLRYVLRAQRDRYLPLKVIREELDRIDAGLPVEDHPPRPDVEAVRTLQEADGESAPALPALIDPGTDVQLSRSELTDATGLAEGDVAALQEHGLLDRGDRFDGDDLQLCKLAATLMTHGLEARHLRMYRQFADREAALYEQLVTPLLRQRNPDSRRAATEQLEVLLDHGARMHRALLAAQLRVLLRS